ALVLCLLFHRGCPLPGSVGSTASVRSRPTYPKMFGEEGQHRFLGFLGIPPPESVSRPIQREEFSLDSCCLQLVYQPDRLLVGYILVFRAMNAEGRSSVGRHPIQRAGENVLVTSLFQIAAQPQRKNLGGVHTLAVGFGKVAGTVIVDDTGHST